MNGPQFAVGDEAVWVERDHGTWITRRLGVIEPQTDMAAELGLTTIRGSDGALYALAERRLSPAPVCTCSDDRQVTLCERCNWRSIVRVGVMNRTQDETVARIEEITAKDFFGFRREVLIGALDYDHAKPYLQDEVNEHDWHPVELETDARDYLTFAIEKILDHRGISAGRSVEKLTEFAWLLGRDDVVAAMAAADYPQYGAPKVRAFAVGMGRMSDGVPCRPGCDEGCVS